MGKCRVCKWEGEAEYLTVREMMYGTREEFTYFICPRCHCLQIETIPDDLGQYYGNNYYSFISPDLTCGDNLYKDGTRILDVGCGAGAWLCALAKDGYVNLVGCDPFIEKDLQYENGVKIYKRTIHEMEGEFDRIVLNDSFEHVTDPHEVMESIHRLLCPDGVGQIAVPIFPNIAYDTFGADWYQLDAPRHIILYSVQGMKFLAEQHNMEIVRVIYDSNNSQFVNSYLYTKGIPYREHTQEIIYQYLLPEDIEKFTKYALEVNKKGYGDHATFILKRKALADNKK